MAEGDDSFSKSIEQENPTVPPPRPPRETPTASHPPRETNFTCNGPIPRRPTGVIEGALWTHVYSFRQPYMSRYCPAHRENGNGGVSNKLLSEVALDQSARMTLYTNLCGN
ncbi:hypothetical protein F2Q69_00044203 [Brassica cretica]|uniref:Uncharacterized protein n=1 Tax=Brassica cretica TaxID=69181 RepID=A0A8S9NC42_BRACR|nr:hypothetical protein F2Q69_00044203 [Brassica cretica]